MQAQTPPQGLGDTHPGEANAADSPTQHVCKHGWVRASRGEVGEEIGTVPVCYLWGRRNSYSGPEESGCIRARPGTQKTTWTKFIKCKRPTLSSFASSPR